MTDERPAPDQPGQPPGPDDHDPTGLDMARHLAARLKSSGSGSSRPFPGRRGGAAGARWRDRRRGEAVRMSGSHPDGRDPALLGAMVDKLVQEAGWETDLKVHGVFGRWDQIVGAEVAQHCRPESYADGHLQVRTDSTAWATQLTLLAPTVVRRLNEELGDGSVLRIDVAGPAAPSWKRGPRSVRGRGPRDTYG